MAIEHIVIIVKENHGFDNYFGTFPNPNGERLGRAENPPSLDPPHDHRTWLRRAGEPRFHVQYPDSLYYRETRTHLGLARTPPLGRSVQPIWDHHEHTNLVRIASSLRAGSDFREGQSSKPGAGHLP
jgi:hypothetical protein